MKVELPIRETVSVTPYSPIIKQITADNYEGGVANSVDTGGAAHWIGHDSVRPALRQSSLSCLMDCPRKFMFRHRFGLSVPTHRSALSVGSLFHILMAGQYTGTPLSTLLADCGELITKDIEALEKFAGVGGVLPGGVMVDSLARTFEQDLALARVLAEVFVARHPKPGHLKPIAVEAVVRMQQAGLPQPIEGTIDVVFHDPVRNELWLADHKTTSISPLKRAAQAMLEVQPRLYRLLAQSLFPDIPVVGFLHNVILKPTIRFGQEDRSFTETEHVLKSGPRKGQTEMRREYEGFPRYENYLARCARWYNATDEYAHLAEKWRDDPPILQSSIRFAEPLMSDELRAILHEGSRASRAHCNLDHFYRRWTSCLGKYGNSVCEYMGLCTSDPVTWQGQVKQGFIREESK